MNRIAKIFLYVAKVLNVWFFVIPFRLNIIATAFYLLLLYLVFGTIQLDEIKRLFTDESILYDFVVLLIGFPCLMSFFAFLAPDGKAGNGMNDTIDSAIRHRNMMAENSTGKEAYEIMKKTAHLDVMRNSSGQAFQNAKKGFDATVGNSSSADIYNNLMDR